MSQAFAAAKSMFNSTDELRYGKDKALSGMVGGQVREQTVLTPDWLLDAIRAVAPIGLDPCTTTDNPVEAWRWFTEEQNGLSEAWDHGLTYTNPPYGDLKPWMQKCWAEARFGVRIYLLAPFRPHRRWFNEYTKGHTVVTLAPFPFKGHKASFPAPLALVCFNLPVPNLGKYETGRWVQL